jgi:hypothetical protein
MRGFLGVCQRIIYRAGGIAPGGSFNLGCNRKSRSGMPDAR